MAPAFQYRPRFVDIRVRPPEPASQEAAFASAPRLCDYAGCRAAGVARAPKDRRRMEAPAGPDHYWFCPPHAAQYNREWNYFAGMSEGEMRAKLEEEQVTGGRPTWSMHSGGRNRESARLRGVFRDPHGLFGPDGRAPSPPADRRLGKLERGALVDLDLPADANGPAIRARYIELVKRCHPDANGGDRSAEHKLQRVLRAYQTLRKAMIA